MQVPLRNKDKTRIKKEVNRFFRKGKRDNAVPYAQRVLPEVLGGLGQLDTDTHLEMIFLTWNRIYLIRAHYTRQYQGQVGDRVSGWGR
jgi:hypothetical protein